MKSKKKNKIELISHSLLQDLIGSPEEDAEKSLDKSMKDYLNTELEKELILTRNEDVPKPKNSQIKQRMSKQEQFINDYYNNEVDSNEYNIPKRIP